MSNSLVPAPTGGPLGKTREFLEMIKFEHTIFALPFAYLTLFLVERGWPDAANFGWITLAMVAGRTFGMAANRLIDAGIDRNNPRTSGRTLPAGRMSRGEVLLFMAVSLVLFALAVFNLSPLARTLSPLVIVVMVFYPYAKRFTWLSHLALGLVYVMIPAGVWIAVTNRLPLEAVALGVGAGFWVAGFDIIYACQDVEVDRREGLHSMPADLGLGPALWCARFFHVIFFVALLAAGLMLGAGAFYYIGLGLAGMLLAFEHRLVTTHNLSRIDQAFFTTNGVISMVLFVLIAVDTVVGST
ncbi:MAG: UbiA-like polyprenyltransferase [Candidatus Krumholzibacteria bacterium]